MSRRATTSVVTRAGHRLHAERWGPVDGERRPDVLLLHGLASNLRLWDGVAERLCGAGHRVVTVDQRGHGRSERPAQGYGWDGVLADVLDVCDAFRLSRPVVVGQSWGGNVVLQLAARHGDRLRGVVAVDGGSIDLADRFPDADAAWAALTPPSFDHLDARELRAHMARRTDGWPDGAADAQLANFVRHPDGTATAALRRSDHEAIVRALYLQRPTQVAADVSVPVLLLPATNSLAPDRETAAPVEALAAALADVTVRWCTEAAHDVHLQHPGLVAGAITDWIDDHVD